MDQRGQRARAAFNDALNAYEYVLDAATRRVEISELWIKELHELVCSSQETYRVYTPAGPQDQPLPKGEYKKMANSPMRSDGTIHAYAPPSDTPAEMYRLILELRSEAFLAAHPIAQAAYAHYAYVAVHPFADGNGRVARALASAYLYRSPGVPFVVFADQQSEYFDALLAPDGGSYGPFLAFVSNRTIDAIGIIRSMLQHSGPTLSRSLEGLTALFDSSVVDEELEAAAVRAASIAVTAFQELVAAINIPSQIETYVGPGRISEVAPSSGYRVIGDGACLFFTASSNWPHKLRRVLALEVFGLIRQGNGPSLMVASREDDGLEIWLREIVPMVSETVKLKLAGWLEGKIAEVLAELASQVTAGEPPT